MPKICTLQGSPHAEGASAHALAAFTAALPVSAVSFPPVPPLPEPLAIPAFTSTSPHIHSFTAYTMAAHPCDGCGYCDEHPLRCRHRDLDGFYAALEACGLWILATPVYHRSFPAPVKAVLDRLQLYYAARFTHRLRPPIATPKAVALITTGGSGRDDGVYLEQQLIPQLTVLNARLMVTCHLKGLDSGWTSTHERQAQEAGATFVFPPDAP